MSDDERYENMTGAELRRNISVEYAKRYDTGHDFSTSKTSDLLLVKNSLLTSSSSGSALVFRGPVIVDARLATSLYPLSDITAYVPSGSQITTDGTKLWSMAVPTAKEASLASFLGELHEGLPQIPAKLLLKKPGPGSAGHEFLNWKFGVQPLKSDLQKMAKGILEFHKKVEQYKRDSGQIVHRRRSFPSSKSDVEVFTGNGMDITYIPSAFGGGELMNYFYDSLGSVRVLDTVEQSTWFTGAYTYHLSEAHDFLGKMERYAQLADHALGIDFDVDTAWELTPWSWLVDWFSDANSFVKNIVAISNDNVVARYAYVMHHTMVQRTFTVTGMRLKPGASGPTSVSTLRTFESKKRTAATPYGFGINMGTLSGTQNAILGALGLTKIPGVLRKG